MSIDIDGDREGTRPHPSVDNWIKDLQHALPTRGRPSFPHSQSSLSNQKACIRLLFSLSEGRQKKQKLYSHSLQNENHNHRKLTNNYVIITWITALYNSMKLRGMLCRAT